MKKLVVLCFLSGLAFATQAQTGSGTKKVLTPSAYEATLVSGALSFFKEFKPAMGESREFVATYFLRKQADPSFNSKKTLQVTLSKQSFEDAFTKTTPDLAAKWPALSRYIENNKISLATESGWVTAIKYFNILQ